jgi:hypothetical protein
MNQNNSKNPPRIAFKKGFLNCYEHLAVGIVHLSVYALYASGACALWELLIWLRHGNGLTVSLNYLGVEKLTTDWVGVQKIIDWIYDSSLWLVLPLVSIAMFYLASGISNYVNSERETLKVD